MADTAQHGISTPETPEESDHVANNATSYITYPMSHIANSIYRRLTEPTPPSRPSRTTSSSLLDLDDPIDQLAGPGDDSVRSSEKVTAKVSAVSIAALSGPSSSQQSLRIKTPPVRNSSPFLPPPLVSLKLTGNHDSSILSFALAEEIRLLLPPRLQLKDEWSLTYSLEDDGVSLSTLYQKCADIELERSIGRDSRGRPTRHVPFVLVVQDAAGAIFGAYLTEAPRPSSSFAGNGECFLWKASMMPANSLLANLPPPPSAPDSTTECMGRSTTIASSTTTSPITPNFLSGSFDLLELDGNHNQASRETIQKQHPINTAQTTSTQEESGLTTRTSTRSPSTIMPPSDSTMRFKAFPYSGVNDYILFCDQSSLSVGGGDSKYGLWLDGVLEKGISGSCMTFGNEPLSDEGEKFDVVGVEVWCVGG